MSTQPARGMRDFLPVDVRRRDHVVGVVREVYERYGFEPLETPAVENIETLLGKYGEEGNKLIFKILKRGEHESTGEADLALRYDLTVPLARVVAEHQAKLPRFFKRYQIQPVWRADRPARGRFREFYQCDVDVVGTTSPVAEADVFAAASEVLSRLGFTAFTIRLNHRGLLAASLRWAGIEEAHQGQVLIGIDKLDKIGPEGVLEDLAARGIDGAGPRKWLGAFGALDGSVPSGERVASLREILREERAADAAFENLEAVLALIRGTAADGHVLVDPCLARGLSYYTGAIMEIAVADLPGSLGGGGRYDNLIGMFLGREVPAVGFSLGLERILVVMSERKMFPDTIAGAAADVMVTLWSADRADDAIALAGLLRAAGLRVDVYPEADKIGKQFKYASSRGIAFVAVVGDDERARGDVTIKNMKSGEQKAVARGEAAAYLRRQASGADDGGVATHD